MSSSETTPNYTALKIRFAIRETLGVVFLALMLFLPSGRWDWVWGWLLVAITFLWVLGTAYILFTRSPDLIEERLGPVKGAKKWDGLIMGIVAMGTLARLLVAAFDFARGWSSGVPVWLQVLSAVVAALAYFLVVWATASNAFFSQIVRIQEDKGHQVASGGPYRFVRHPAYVGTILFELFTPLMLGSWWALIPGAFNAALFITRTALEDKTLLAELPGYPEFAQETKYRLLPGLW